MFAGTSEWCDALWKPSVTPLLAINAIAELARDHERRYARDVRAPREHEQIEHQHRVLLEIGRDAVRLVGHVDRGERRVRGEREPPLDLANVREIVVEAHAVRARQIALQRCDVARDRVEQARQLALTCRALGRGAAVAE